MYHKQEGLVWYILDMKNQCARKNLVPGFLDHNISLQYIKQFDDIATKMTSRVQRIESQIASLEQG